MLALAATDPCSAVLPAASPDRAAAAEYRAVAEAEQASGHHETAVVAWRLAAANDPDDPGARAALAALCRAGPWPREAPVDPVREAIRLLDAGKYREAAELLHGSRQGPPTSDAALVEGICRYELGEDVEAARLLREAESDPAHRETARLYLGLVALRGGAAREAAALFNAAASSPSLQALATDLSRTARWDGPILLSVLMEAGWDSNVLLTGVDSTGGGGGGMASNGDAVGGLSAVVVGRPFGANGLFLRGAGALQEYAKLNAYDFTSVEAAAGGRYWRGGTGISAEYSFADRTLGGEAYLTTHRLLATGSVASGPFALSGSWWGRWEEYASIYTLYSGFSQRADGRLSVALGARARLGAGWMWGRDDADASYLGWKEHGPRADLRVVLGPATRLAVEGGYTSRRYSDYDPNLTTLSERLKETVLDGTAALEWDVARRTTLRFALSFRNLESNLDDYGYTKWVPSAALGVMVTP